MNRRVLVLIRTYQQLFNLVCIDFFYSFTIPLHKPLSINEICRKVNNKIFNPERWLQEDGFIERTLPKESIFTPPIDKTTSIQINNSQLGKDWPPNIPN